MLGADEHDGNNYADKAIRASRSWPYSWTWLGDGVVARHCCRGEFPGCADLGRSARGSRRYSRSFIKSGVLKGLAKLAQFGRSRWCEIRAEFC